MPRTEFIRVPLRIHVNGPLTDGGVAIALQVPKRDSLSGTQGVIFDGWQSHPVNLTGDELSKWFKGGGLPATLLSPVKDAALPFQQARSEAGALHQSSDDRAVPIVEIALGHPSLASEPWEQAVFTILAAIYTMVGVTFEAVVRTVPTPPRALSIPMTLPLRVLQVGPDPSLYLPTFLRDVFGNHTAADVDLAVAVESLEIDSVETFRFDQRWPSVHILHFSTFPGLAPDLQFSTAKADQPGTLGWLSRLTDTWQTRLVVFVCQPDELPVARRLCWSLAARGGPAGLAVASGSSLMEMYIQIIHDFPVDLAAGPSWLGPGPSILTTSTSRSESLRVSQVAVQLMELERLLSRPGGPANTDERIDIRRVTRRRDADPWALDALRRAIGDRLTSRWDDIRFDQHEGDGLLPTSVALREAREAMHVDQASVRALGEPEPRFVNLGLEEFEGEATSREIQPQGARLRLGEPVALVVQIGPRDGRVRVFGAEAILEEVFKWTPELQGVWVDVAVSGMDFEVLGDPVQELWLPQAGPSDEIRFAVRPMRSGVSSLRVSLYQSQNVVQSLRLAAMVVEGDEKPSGDLAAVLSVPSEFLDGAGFAARLEYSLGSTADSLLEEKPRTLSFVVNDNNGEPWISIKGEDVWIETNQNLGAYVAELRGAMNPFTARALYPFIPGRAEEDLAADFKLAMLGLAAAGWSLYRMVVKQGDDEKVRQLLEEDGRTIHVADMLVDKVIPWAGLYDRHFDAQAEDDTGAPILPEVCTAPIPDAEGTLPALRCKANPACLLHPDQQAARAAAGQPALDSSVVVCPLRFWGLRHVIELPVQQVEPGSAPQPARSCISGEDPPSVMLGVHPGLATTPAHVSDLEHLFGRLGLAWSAPASTRKAILDALSQAGMDLVYLYCHAYGDRLAGPFPPYLQVRENPPAQIRPEQLPSVTWDHHPLVVLNGCGTGAFSPDAVSEFVRTMVKDHRAAGVVATEISVWEQLATRVATLLLEDVLSGKEIGPALLKTRLRLLHERNPLALAYTLYAPLELRLVTDGTC